jgi:phosphate starvation-inducible PhoH-like protein
MTDTHREDGALAPATTTRHTVVVPTSIDMVNLLGPGDEFLGIIEGAFDAEIHVRGNRISMEGEPGEVALATRPLTPRFHD